MLCPTSHTQRLLEDWKARFDFRWTTRLCPWPIDVAAFPYLVRSVCRRYVTINGSPVNAAQRDSTFWSKPLDACRGSRFSSGRRPARSRRLPPNVELRAAAASNRDLYSDGDVCVQLSRWEGLGLPLLECQAAGLPLITTDAPPMNEHNPLAVVPVAGYDRLELWHGRSSPCPRCELTTWRPCWRPGTGGTWRRRVSRRARSSNASIPGPGQATIVEWLEDLR